MNDHRRALACVISSVVLLAACGSSAPAATQSAAAGATDTPSAVASGTSTSGATDTASAAAPGTASSGPGGTASDQASGTPAASSPAAASPGSSAPAGTAPDLEAMIPSGVGQITLLKTSVDFAANPAAFTGAPFRTTGLLQFLESHGKTIADLRYASAQAPASGANVLTVVIAIQIRGVPGAESANVVSSGYSLLLQNDGMENRGGKPVVWVFGGGIGSATYVHDDIVFIVRGSIADVTALLQQLP